jgi:hypothetical protein
MPGVTAVIRSSGRAADITTIRTIRTTRRISQPSRRSTRGKSSSSRIYCHRNLPIILAGECHGAYNTGRHIDYEPNKSVNGPPIANLFLTMMAAMDVNQSSFGDNSTGLLGQLMLF